MTSAELTASDASLLLAPSRREVAPLRRAVDVIVAITALLVLAPICLAIAAAIALEGDELVRLDRDYLAARSLRSDVTVLVRTLGCVARRTGR